MKLSMNANNVKDNCLKKCHQRSLMVTFIIDSNFILCQRISLSFSTIYFETIIFNQLEKYHKHTLKGFYTSTN